MRRVVSVLAAGLLLAGTQVMAATAFGVKDPAGGTDKMTIADNGYIQIGSYSGNLPPARGFQMIAPFGMGTQLLILEGDTTTSTPTGGGTILLGHNNANKALPKMNDRLGNISFVTQDTTVSGLQGIRGGGGINAYAEEDWVSFQGGAATGRSGMYMTFNTYPVNGGSTTKERMRLTSLGNLGIGSTAPTQRLEVNGGIRINTADVKPACDATSRGTLWFTQLGSAVMSDDMIEICIMDMSGAYVWRQLPLY